MLFPTFGFIFLFLPLVFVSFWILKKTAYSQFIVMLLLLWSLAFYLLPNWYHGPIFIVSIVVNFLISRKIESGQAKTSKALLITGIAFNLCIIGYFKYLFFFSEMVEAVSGLDFALNKLVLPVGISFYTFQQIAYLCDCYKYRNINYKFHEYALFVSFFPQLIAGPIVHHQEMMPQISKLKDRPINWFAFQIGCGMFIIGLVKKLAIADNLAKIADPIFALTTNQEVIETATAWLGTVAYTLQLYFDFSAYSDMAIGLGLMFGLKLPVNFMSPYKAVSIIDFWRRWHITLSRFLRDYLYIPLGGNRYGLVNRYRNLMITMLLGGLWHGAGINFILWGGLHGAYLAVNHGYNALAEKHNLRISKFLSQAITLLAVMIAWVFFRAENFPSAMYMLTSMFSVNLAGGVGSSVAFSTIQIMLVFVALFIALYCPNTVEIFRYKNLDIQSVSRANVTRRTYILTSVVMGLILGASLMFIPQPTVFIYFNF